MTGGHYSDVSTVLANSRIYASVLKTAFEALDQKLYDFATGAAALPTPNIDGGTIDGAALNGVTLDNSVIGGVTPAASTFTRAAIAAGTVAGLTNKPLSVAVTYTGTASEIASPLSFDFHDARTTANQANQVLRFSYTRDAGATATPADRDSALVIATTFNASQTAEYEAVKIEGPNVAAGKTVGSTRGVHIQDGGGSGTLTTQYGLLIDSLTKGASNYAIYTGSGTVRLGGDLDHDGSNIGFYGTTPASQYSSTGLTTGWAAGSGGSTMKSVSTANGNIGSRDYTFSDVVAALKRVGIMAS